MNESFADMLIEDGKKNSLGRANEVVELVLKNHSSLEELYQTIFNYDAWVRMRAIDAFEKVCRVHPEWIEPYIDKIQAELSGSAQASIQWHIAQIYKQVELTLSQREVAVNWLKTRVSSNDVDWIVAANTMDTLAYFVRKSYVSKADFFAILDIQNSHKSASVVKRVNKLRHEFIEKG